LAAGSVATFAEPMPADERGDPLIDELVRQRKSFNETEPPSRWLVPGEAVLGWSEQGVDVPALLREAPGGTEANFIVIGNDFSVSLAAYGTAPYLQVPVEWRELERIQGENGWTGEREYYIQFAGDSLVVVSAHPVHRIGRAVCVDHRGPSGLYAVGGAPLSSLDQSYRQRFAAIQRRSHGTTICYTAHETAPGLYAYRYFDERGHSFPLLDAAGEGDRVSIEPRQPIESHRRRPD
jgi:hypothetical protein